MTIDSKLKMLIAIFFLFGLISCERSESKLGVSVHSNNNQTSDAPTDPDSSQQALSPASDDPKNTEEVNTTNDDSKGEESSMGEPLTGEAEAEVKNDKEDSNLDNPNSEIQSETNSLSSDANGNSITSMQPEPPLAEDFSNHKDMGAFNLIKANLGHENAVVPGIPLSSRIFHVDQATGNDSNDGSSLGTAWETIGANINTLLPGDHLVIHSGVYRESVEITSSGTIEEPIVIRSFEADNVQILGSRLLEKFVRADKVESQGIFADTFEIANLDAYNSTSIGGSNQISFDQTNAITDQYLKISFAGSSDSARLNKSLSQDFADVYARIYFYVSSDMNIADSTRLDLLFLRDINSDSSSDDRARISIAQDGAALKLEGRLYHDVTGTLTTRKFYSGVAGEVIRETWNYAEIRYRGDRSTDGGAELWLNGTKLDTELSYNTENMIVNRVEFGSHSGGTGTPPNGSSILLDNLKLDDAPIGAFAGRGSSEVWIHSGITYTARRLLVDGIDIANAPDATTASSTDGSFYLDPEADEIHLNLVGSSAPQSHTIEATKESQVFLLNEVSNVEIRGLQISLNNTAGEAGLVILGGENNRIYNSLFSNNKGSGIRIGNKSKTNKITGCQFSNNLRDFGGGIRVDDASKNTFAYNSFNGNFISSGIMIRCQDSGSVCEENIIEYNVFEENWDSALYLNYNVDKSIVRGNWIDTVTEWASGGGNGIHVGINGDYNLIENNIILNLESHGISLRENSNNNIVQHNTVYLAGVKTGGSGIDLHYSTSFGSASNLIKANIVYTAGEACMSVDELSVSAGGNVFEFNLCFKPGGKDLYWWNSLFYDSLEEFKTVSNQGQGSVQGDPSFMDIDNNDFSLSFDSIAKNKVPPEGS